MKLSLQILSIVFLCFVIGCRAKEEPITREKLLSKGFILMDEGQYDEAIKYFEELNAVDPHHHVKIAWASAYAGRAGVKSEQIYSFTVIKNIPAIEISIEAVSADIKIKKLLTDLSRYAEHWKKVPVVSREKLDDIYSAVKILEQTDHSGARLYCAALRVVLIKSSVAAALINWNAQQKICTGKLQAYLQYGVAILKQVFWLTQDLELSFPENKKEYQSIAQPLEDIIIQLNSVGFPKENQCF